jgi:flagellar hook-associated protein 1 FlgK
MGYGINEYKNSKDRAVFTGIDNIEDAAAKINTSYKISNDPAALSTALTPTSSGDNIIVNELIRASYEKMFDNGETDVGGFYDNIISKLGSISAHKRNDSEASQIVLDQLNQKRDSMSGVSLDEEAIELLKYQHLFAASSKIITTADEMMQTVLDLKR